jgi:hypothetical protein
MAQNPPRRPRHASSFAVVAGNERDAFTLAGLLEGITRVEVVRTRAGRVEVRAVEHTLAGERLLAALDAVEHWLATETSKSTTVVVDGHSYVVSPRR